MNGHGLIELLVFVGALLAITKPMGLHLERVLDPRGKTVLDRALRPVERGIYRAIGVDPEKEQGWLRYSTSVIVFSAVGLLFTYAILRLQNHLPLNPQGYGPVRPDLAFNTAASFTTNTNWQNYPGEATLSYFSQMVGLVYHNFVSAAAGIAVAAALVRGIARQSAAAIGNFWVDLVRVNLYLLLPLCTLFALFLVSQGVVDNFKPALEARTIQSAAPRAGRAPGAPIDAAGARAAATPLGQTIAQGPAASQAAIKMLGTNGGGFFNANASHPYENPTPLSNFIQMLSIFCIPSGLTYYLGRTVGNRRHGWTVWSAMMILFLVSLFACWGAESSGNPRLAALGVDPAGGNMEGKEMRFGIFDSALFAVVTTDASCGAVNSMHDSYTPLGGMMPLFNIQLGEVAFGGVGSGLYGMIVFVVLAVFLTGLMVGRTPEYLGKKIEIRDVKLCAVVLLVGVFGILGFTAWAAASRWGAAGPANAGPHGQSEMLYAFSSCIGNNGSAFAGLNGNTYWYNTTLGVAALIGRFFMLVPVLALAGSFAGKRLVPATKGSLPVHGAAFALVLVATVILVGALSFLPALALGPIVEHFVMTASPALY
jgi:K+-transporting ATPase ATPase A chain